MYAYTVRYLFGLLVLALATPPAQAQNSVPTPDAGTHFVRDPCTVEQGRVRSLEVWGSDFIDPEPMCLLNRTN